MWTFVMVCIFHGFVVKADRILANKGYVELQRVKELAKQPRYGECWSRALENIHTGCREFTDDTQSKIALAFTHCHLRRSDRRFPDCPSGSDVKACTKEMDSVAFNTFTEFFTHAHSICYYLQNEQWQLRAESTIHRLTESSAGVAEQLALTQRVAEDLVEAQTTALKSQETILRNGEELKVTLHDSTQGLREVFAEMRHSAQEQQVAFAEIFNRVAFLQSFMMSESHTFSSLFYNTLGFCAAFFLTSTSRTSGARFFLFGVVALNVYLERMICQTVLENESPGYQQMEQIAILVGLLRKAMILIGILVLVYFAVRYRNVNRESLAILNQLKETHANLQQALCKAECLSGKVDGLKAVGPQQWQEKWQTGESEAESVFSSTCIQDTTSPSFAGIHESRLWNFPPPVELFGDPVSRSSERPQRRQHRSRASSALVYSVLVDDEQPRYSLRSRKSLSGPGLNGMKN